MGSVPEGGAQVTVNLQACGDGGSGGQLPHVHMEVPWGEEDLAARCRGPIDLRVGGQTAPRPGDFEQSSVDASQERAALLESPPDRGGVETGIVGASAVVLP